ncbi:MAG TPA: hypothetical protein VFB10_10425 [Candidatus Dormibacteraeota bacterium]|nr:hypothetical protein [Candidatus Dormibacteraeota bacterium]
MAALLGASRPAGGYPASSLQPATIRAFENYVAAVEARSGKSLAQGDFFWLDELAKQKKEEAYERLKGGKVELRHVSGEEEGRNSTIPGGMIHDWQGMIFIPGAKLDEVLSLLQDYGRHATYYAPDVERAKIEAHDGNHFRVFMRFRRKKIVTVVLNTEQEITYYRDSPTRAHSRSSAIRIAEVENAGTPEEREKTPGSDNGFMWRLETWWRMEERDGGVYVQNEAVSLTRDIPAVLAWMIEPFVTSIPKESVEFTLQATRRAVLDRKGR